MGERKRWEEIKGGIDKEDNEKKECSVDVEMLQKVEVGWVVMIDSRLDSKD